MCDGDKVVASCEKAVGASAVLVTSNDADWVPLSRADIAANLSIALTYIRVTAIVAMFTFSQVPFLFVSFFLVSLLCDNLSRYEI
jgi:hypothetical protein